MCGVGKDDGISGMMTMDWDGGKEGGLMMEFVCG